jgi:hypothetical protein
MTAHLTAAEARRLGFDVPATAARPRATRKALARDRAVSTCHTCGATFTTDAAETRHVAATCHARYAMAIGVTPTVYAPRMSDDPTVPDPDVPVDPDDADPDDTDDDDDA